MGQGRRAEGESPKRIAFLRKIAEELPGAIEYMDEDKGWLLSDEYKEMIANHPDELEQRPMVQFFLHQSEVDKLTGQIKDEELLRPCGRGGLHHLLRNALQRHRSYDAAGGQKVSNRSYRRLGR